MRNWLVCWSVCLAVLAVQAEPAPADAMSRPARPKSFASPDDLRTYLDQLGQYYAVAGRPRFGKRTNMHNSPRLHLAVEGLNYRYPTQDIPTDIYDLLYQPLAE